MSTRRRRATIMADEAVRIERLIKLVDEKIAAGDTTLLQERYKLFLALRDAVRTGVLVKPYDRS